MVYGNKNWVPSTISGTTPSFLDVRDWNSLEDGEVFSDRDVLNANKVCLIGQTIKRELFQGEPPIGKELRIKNVAFKVIGILTSKGANMMGMDQDDIIIAPWTTIKYRVAGTTLANTNQSANSNSGSSVNTLSQIYPSATVLYPEQSSLQVATPLCRPDSQMWINLS